MKDQSTSKKTAPKKKTDKAQMKKRLQMQEAALKDAPIPEVPKIEESQGPGQPTKYRPEFCQMLKEHMSKGLSFETFGAIVNVGRATLYNWEKEHEEFLDAHAIGEVHCQLLHEQIGVSGQSGHLPGFQQSAWRFNMQNRFGWRDRSDLTSDGKGLPPTTVNLNLPRNGFENPDDVEKG
jgi:DNA-binding transcriptional regulator YiaG